MHATRQSIILRRRPAGEPTVDDFSLTEEPMPTPGMGEVLHARSGCQLIQACAYA